MRKRIAIAVLAIIGVGVLVYVVSQPKPGTIEWHKRKYLANFRTGGFVPALEYALGIRSKETVQTQADIERINFHENALIKAGYLEERILIVSNRSPDNVLLAACTAAVATRFVSPEHIKLEPMGSNAIRLVTVTNNAQARISRWEQLIHQADAPKTPN